MSIVVALQTADRPDYTARTLASFAAHNDLSRFVLVHGDDASVTRENIELAARYGFATVSKPKAPIGCLAMRTRLLQKAAMHGEWVLLLENDIESVRPFPWALFDVVKDLDWVYALRLFGEFKGPNQTAPCKNVNQWKPEKPVVWKRLRHAPEPAEHAVIHWSAQPTVTRARPLLDLHLYGVKELRRKTVRVVDNVMVHIGDVRTRQLPRRKVVA